MKSLRIIALLSLQCLLIGCATPIVKQPDDLSGDIQLTNGHVIVDVSPIRARIMGYQLVGKSNILWQGIVWYPHDVKIADLRWNNYGGSRVWVLPQGITQRMVLNRHDPPDIFADGLPWNLLHQDDYSVVMQSDVSPQTGLQLKRKIVLSQDDSTVTIHDKMTRVLDIDCPVHLWRITQTIPAKYMLMDLKDNPSWKYQVMLGHDAFSKRDTLREMDHGHALKVDWIDSICTKVGSYGDWLASVYDDQVFIQYGKYDSDSFYIDGANSEIYVDPQAHMLEVESLSPTKMLNKGQSLESKTYWKLLPVRTDEIKNILNTIRVQCDQIEK